VDPTSIAATLRGAIAQRLVRTVCPECHEKTGGKLTPEEKTLAERNGVKPTVRTVGCKNCGDSGYRGRNPVCEVITMTPNLQSLIAKGAPHLELRRAAHGAGFRSVRESALDHVHAGATTLQELERVLGEPSDKDELGEDPMSNRFRRIEDKAEAKSNQEADADVGPGLKPRTTTKRARKTTRQTTGRRKSRKATRSKQTSTTTADVWESTAAPAESDEKAESNSAAAHHVLLVEDDPVTRKQAKRLLMKEGYEVTEAVDGEHALKRLEANKDFALIVTDLHMPRLDGRGVIAKVRGNAATAGLPIIVLTASTDPETEIELMDEGADDYIRKPIDPPHFHARIRGVLRRAGVA